MTTLKEELARYAHEVESYLTTSNGIGIVLLSHDLTILDCNLGFMRLLNPRQKPVGEPLSSFIEMDGADLRSGREFKLPCSRKSRKTGIVYCFVIESDKGFILFCERQLLTESFALEQMGAMNDELINLQRELIKKSHLQEKTKLELDDRIFDLESALKRIKTLEGIISICMYCKKIRNEHESWEHLEQYITEHTDAFFSHSICPECLAEHFPEAIEN